MSGFGERRLLPLEGNREVMWCHSCQRDWYHDEHEGNDCPHCHSEVTETIDPNDDPRFAIMMDEMIQRGLGDGGDSAGPDTPAEGGLESENDSQTNTSRNTYFYSTTTTTGPDGVRVTRSSSNINDHNPWASNPGSPFMNMNPVSTLLNQLMGMHGMPGASDPSRQARQDTSQRSSPAPDATQDAPGPQPGSGLRMGFGYSSSGPGGSRTFTFGTPQRTEHDPDGGMRPRDAAGFSTRPEVQPMEDLFSNILQMHAAPFAGARGDGGPVPNNPLHHILASLLNPANAAHGDAVFTQEAFDRVISQLMEQNSGSNAPPPAAEADIDALPTIKVEKSMLGEKGEGECSVCMDNVELGEEVVSLPCKHWFHRQCVSMWLKEHDTCPICRKGISKPGEGGANSGSPQPPGGASGTSQFGGGRPFDGGNNSGSNPEGGAGSGNTDGAARGPLPGPFSFFHSGPIYSQPPSRTNTNPFAARLGGPHPSPLPISTIHIRRAPNGVSAIAIMSFTTSPNRRNGSLRTEPYPHFLPFPVDNSMPRTAPTRPRHRSRPQSQNPSWRTPNRDLSERGSSVEPSRVEPSQSPLWTANLQPSMMEDRDAEDAAQRPDGSKRGITGRIRDFFTGSR